MFLIELCDSPLARRTAQWMDDHADQVRRERLLAEFTEAERKTGA